MTQAQRKHHELRRKLVGLAEELAYWQSESADGKPLRLHRSQIGTVMGLEPVNAPKNRAPLAALWRDVAARVGANPPLPEAAASFLDRATEAEYLLLGAHTVWGFFREKLAQRYTESSRNFLALADELAWACYQPARDAAQGKQSAPLTYLAFIERLGPGDKNVLTTPALWARGGTEWLPPSTPAVFRQPISLKKILEPLAIPILGLPWVTASHLPDLPVIAHETGHAVEEDFHLTGELRTGISRAVQVAKAAGIDPGPEDAWQEWMGELFADAHGLAHLGAAYASTLIDLLSGMADRGRPEDRSLASYPTHSLRVRFNLAALRELGFAKEALALAARWLTAVPNDPPSPAYDGGVPFMARQLIQLKLAGLGGRSLADLGRWDPPRRAQLAEWSNPLNTLAVTTRDTRLVTAALRQVYDQDHLFYMIIRAVLVSHLQGNAPQVSVEIGRGNVPTIYQPNFQEMEQYLQNLPAVA